MFILLDTVNTVLSVHRRQIDHDSTCNSLEVETSSNVRSACMMQERAMCNAFAKDEVYVGSHLKFRPVVAG